MMSKKDPFADQKKTSWLKIRCSPAQLSKIKMLARMYEQSVTEWVIGHALNGERKLKKGRAA
jgi:hypothetical protein